MSRPGAIVAAASAALAATAAPAEVIYFSDPTQTFVWLPYFSAPPGTPLNITLPPTQPGTPDPIGIAWNLARPIASGQGVIHRVYPGTAARVVRSTVPVSVPLNPGRNADLFPPLDFGASGAIGPGLNWQTQADLGWFRSTAGGDHFIVGNAFTMGVQINLGDGPHFGYIRFVFGRYTGFTMDQYIPTEWAYETLPDTPILVPAPAAAALLGLALASRRRRPATRQE